MNTRLASSVLVEAFLPRLTRAQNALLVVAGSLLVALSAQLSLPLPFSPVPVTGQTFAVLLLGASLGARRGAAALILYLMQGAAGLPVFAPGGLPGLARFSGPTGGYLLAYPLAAFLVGWMLERSFGPRLLRLLAGVAAAEALILGAGTAWLKLVLQTGWTEAAALGLLPFLPGELAKAALLVLCLPASWWAVEARRSATRS